MSEAEAERFLWHVWYYLIDTDPSAIANQDALAIIREAIYAVMDAQFYW